MRLRAEAYGFVEGVRWALAQRDNPPTLFEVLTEARKRWPDFEPEPPPVKAPNLHLKGNE